MTTFASIAARSPEEQKRWIVRLAAYGCAFVLLVYLGSLQLRLENVARPDVTRIAVMRVLFAMLLFMFVLARCLWNFRMLADASKQMRRDFDRLTARSVYLLLYLLVGYQLTTDLSAASPLHTEHCQYFLACGIASILLIRFFEIFDRRSAGVSAQVAVIEHTEKASLDNL